MNPVAVSATAASVSALVALSALALSLYNYFRAKGEPARARQREIRDQLRYVIQPARHELKEAIAAAEAGRTIPKPTAEFLAASSFVDAHWPRRADELDQSRTRAIAVGLLLAAHHLTDATKSQEAADKATAYLNEKIDLGPDATMDTKDRARAAQREKDQEFETAKARFLGEAATTLSQITQEIERLDAFDRGVVNTATQRRHRRR